MRFMASCSPDGGTCSGTGGRTTHLEPRSELRHRYLSVRHGSALCQIPLCVKAQSSLNELCEFLSRRAGGAGGVISLTMECESPSIAGQTLPQGTGACRSVRNS